MDNSDRQRFVETLAEACAKTGWQVQHPSRAIVQFPLLKENLLKKISSPSYDTVR